MKIVNNVVHPFRTFEKLRWKTVKRKMCFCGCNTTAKWCFSISYPENIRIGNNVHIGHHCEIHAFPLYNGENTRFIPDVQIEDDVVIADYSYISCVDKVYIGRGTLLGANTFITDNYHGDNTDLSVPPDQRSLYSKGPVSIGKNVWTGRNVCIMPGVTIGDGAVIGANAVVTHDIPAYCVAAGIPAKIIREMKANNV